MKILRKTIFAIAVTIVGLTTPVFAASVMTASGYESDANTTTQTSIYSYNLPGSVSDCVGLYPKPNCGTEPQLSGDRGGVMQYVTFGIIIIGLLIIMTVIARSVIRTDRIKNNN